MLTVNFNRFLIQSRRLWKKLRQSAFLPFISFVNNVIPRQAPSREVYNIVVHEARVYHKSIARPAWFYLVIVLWDHMRSQRMRQLSAKFTPSWSKHVFALRTKTLQIFFTMQECSPSSTPTSAVRGKEKLSKGEQGTNEVRKSAGTSASQKGGKKPPALKDNTSERSNI